jgi:16S rRNA (guanine527-N7)-methyltransferase
LSSTADALAALQDWSDWALRKDLAARQWHQLEQYLDTLLFWNRRLALVSQHEPDAVVTKHFADSLFAASLCTRAETAVDLGSGAGFPGIPIAICLPGLEVCLIESRAKKVTFLREAVRLCGLSNVEVVEARIESMATGPRAGHYGLVVSRALGDLASFLRLSLPFLTDSGRALAMKGPHYEDDLRVATEANTGFVLEQVIRYHLPDATPRALLMFHVKHS